MCFLKCLRDVNLFVRLGKHPSLDILSEKKLLLNILSMSRFKESIVVFSSLNIITTEMGSLFYAVLVHFPLYCVVEGISYYCLCGISFLCLSIFLMANYLHYIIQSVVSYRVMKFWRLMIIFQHFYCLV